jgi:hypothetical protein
MKSLFDPADLQSVKKRLSGLQPGAQRQWGKMSAGQMLAHCSVAMEMATGDQPRSQKLIGKILGPFFKSALLSEKPFSKDSPTDPAFVIKDDRDFEAEKRRLTSVVDRFCERGPGKAEGKMHSFLGTLTGEEWGRMMFKHLDHHLRQFGA